MSKDRKVQEAKETRATRATPDPKELKDCEACQARMDPKAWPECLEIWVPEDSLDLLAYLAQRFEFSASPCIGYFSQMWTKPNISPVCLHH